MKQKRSPVAKQTPLHDVSVLALKALWMELFGTFFIVYVSGWALEWKSARLETNLGVAVAMGSVYSVFTFIGQPLGAGYYNPAICICLALTRRIHILQAALFIVCQVIASIFAALFLDWLQEGYLEKATRGSLGLPKLGSNISQVSGFFIELVGSALLMFTFFSVYTQRKNAEPVPPETSAPMIGIVYAFCIMTIGNATGAALNPARVMGPAIVTNSQVFYEQLWVYWLGPIAGGLIGSLVYIVVCLDETPAKLIKHADFEEQIINATRDPGRQEYGYSDD